MSLHCPATLYVVRHGDVAYARPHVISDDDGWLTPRGREQSVALARRLAGERIARVYSSDLHRAVETAQVVAEALGTGAEVIAGLAEVRCGDSAGKPYPDLTYPRTIDAWLRGDLDARVPGGESGEEVMARFHAALEEIADRHRGEQVLVITHGGIMSVGLPRLAANTHDDLAIGRFLPNAVPARLVVGDEGWLLFDWPGLADKSVD